MIGYLEGEILDHREGKMLVGIGDQNTSGRVGYHVTVPQSAAYAAYFAGQRIELFVYTHVREEALDLYGFATLFEKELFLTLLSVNGIGPKSALGVISGIEATQLLEAIIQGDQALLTRTPGIGKKTAERIVVELRDSVKKKVDLGVFSLKGGASAELKSNLKKKVFGDSDRSGFQDAKDALLGLGYREQDVHQLLSRVMEEEGKSKRAEDLIRIALKQLN